MFAPPRRLSRLAASFFGFLCQGIRRAPLTSSSYKAIQVSISFLFAIVQMRIIRLIDDSHLYRCFRYATVKVRGRLGASRREPSETGSIASDDRESLANQ